MDRWSPAERRAVVRVLEALSGRFEIEEWLGRRYGLRGVSRDEGVEYSGPRVGGWIRVRYREGELLSAVVLDR